MDWHKIWNSDKISNDMNAENSYKHNGYLFDNPDEFHKFIEEISKSLNIKNNDRILDIGCGNGYFLNYLINKRNLINCQIYGFDFSEKNINIAKKNFIGTYFVHDMHNLLPFDSNYFDVIICTSCLFYMDNENSLYNLMGEIERVSKIQSAIFFGNCMDIEKKNIAESIRKDTHLSSSSHLYIHKNTFINYFKNHEILIIDNEDLALDFYSGQKYKYNVYIKKTHTTENIGVDFHDTLTYNPRFFKTLLKNFKGKKFIITGTPLSKKETIKENLRALNFIEGEDYDDIECGYEYNKEEMTHQHFEKMKKHKLEILKKNNITIYFDDNPYYVNYLKDYNIFVYQTILSKKYIDTFKLKDNYFCCNLQENQFEFIKNFIKDRSEFLNNKIYIPGVFDLFHIGHLKLLKNIKENHNGFIIIGLQSDESVKKQKGHTPTMTFNERKEILINLNIIDSVIEYEKIDQSDILNKYNITTFVIGPEFGSCEEHINTLNYCKINNINVIITERTPNISTSHIIQRVLQHT
jgi:glycerol-3-phosphate cytidylyltransferase